MAHGKGLFITTDPPNIERHCYQLITGFVFWQYSQGKLGPTMCYKIADLAGPLLTSGFKEVTVLWAALHGM